MKVQLVDNTQRPVFVSICSPLSAPYHVIFWVVILLLLILTGTRVDDAKALMAASDLKVIPCDSLDDAAALVSSVKTPSNLTTIHQL
mgnify:CR=1 FL=1